MGSEKEILSKIEKLKYLLKSFILVLFIWVINGDIIKLIVIKIKLIEIVMCCVIE